MPSSFSFSGGILLDARGLLVTGPAPEDGGKGNEERPCRFGRAALGPAELRADCSGLLEKWCRFVEVLVAATVAAVPELDIPRVHIGHTCPSIEGIAGGHKRLLARLVWVDREVVAISAVGRIVSAGGDAAKIGEGDRVGERREVVGNSH